MQFGPSQKAVTGLKATIGGRQEKAALACPVQANYRKNLDEKQRCRPTFGSDSRSPKGRGAARR